MSLNITIDRDNIYKESVGRIPTDKAYIGKIIGAKEIDYNTNSGYHVHRLDVAFDITEGDYKGYYKARYDADTNEDKKWKGIIKINIPKGDNTEKDGWTIKSFNTQICAIEDSNPGYTWDNVLEHLKDKKIGVVFRDSEYEIDGRCGIYSEPFKIIAVKDAEAQNFRKPRAKTLNNSTTQASGFVPIRKTWKRYHFLMTPYEVEKALNELTLIVDTREQTTARLEHRLESAGLPYIRKKLDYGDYSAKCGDLDLSGDVVIERKMNLDELALCFTSQRKRFENEFIRAKEAGAKVYLLIENATLDTLYSEDAYKIRCHSQFKRKAMLASITAFIARYGIYVIFINEDNAGLIIREILYREMKERLLNV